MGTSSEFPKGDAVSSSHLPELQSIRGIAAMTVLLHHSSFVFATTPGFRYVGEALLNAHAAVVMFFVLSGYVLSRSLSGSGNVLAGAGKFYFRRIFRIYPAIFLMVPIGFLYANYVHWHFPTPHPSAWFLDRYSAKPFGLKDVVENMLSIQVGVLPPMWSVRIEIMGSFLMPFICLGVRGKLGIALIILTAALSLSLGDRYALADYTVSFVIGAWAYRHSAILAKYLNVWWSGAIAVAVLIFFRLVNPAWDFEVDYPAAIPSLVESLASAALIVFVVEHRKWSFLRSKACVFIGDISYSVYLLHFPVMCLLSKLPVWGMLPQNISALGLMVLTASLTIPLAALSYRFIEKPGIELGKWSLSQVRKAFPGDLLSRPARD